MSRCAPCDHLLRPPRVAAPGDRRRERRRQGEGDEISGPIQIEGFSFTLNTRE